MDCVLGIFYRVTAAALLRDTALSNGTPPHVDVVDVRATDLELPQIGGAAQISAYIWNVNVDGEAVCVRLGAAGLDDRADVVVSRLLLAFDEWEYITSCDAGHPAREMHEISI